MNPYKIMAQIAVPDGAKINIDDNALQSNEQARSAYAFKPKKITVVSIALMIAVYVAAVVSLKELDAASAMLLVYMTGIATVIIITDLKCLIIPWQLAAALLPASMLWQLLQEGWNSLLVATAAGVGARLLFFLTDKLFYILGRHASVGGGDRRILTPIFVACGFPNCLYATFISCIVTLAIVALLQLIGKRRIADKDTTIPFGPSLSAILLLGLAMQTV